jgi:hypothetical protein
MELKDLLLTPLYLPFIYIWAMFYRRRHTNVITRRYFMPAFWVKIIGAVALGLIYQFYYKGGDTYNYFYDTRIIWQAFLDSPFTAISIIFSDGKYHSDIQQYTQQIYFYTDPHSFPVVRVAGFFALFTFYTYTLIAIFFAVSCFTGMWAMYEAWYDMYPKIHKQLAIACFFIPSVFFWGSGLMKDTITLAALGWLFHGFYFGLIKRQRLIVNIIIIIISGFVIQVVKTYILLCFLPAASLWLFLHYRSLIKSRVVRFVSLPFVLALSIPAAYFAVNKITEENSRYKLENIALTTQETAQWLLYVSNQQGGSAYSLGEFDGSLGNLVSKFPQAVFITLYRPFLWETRNPVMLLSAIESTVFIVLTLGIFRRMKITKIVDSFQKQPVLLFCLLFAIVFSFGVGVASYNFGTLVRYKIPMMPFFLVALYAIREDSRVLKKKRVTKKPFLVTS